MGFALAQFRAEYKLAMHPSTRTISIQARNEINHIPLALTKPQYETSAAHTIDTSLSQVPHRPDYLTGGTWLSGSVSEYGVPGQGHISDVLVHIGQRPEAP